MGAMHADGLAPMVVMGVLTSVVAPALVLLARLVGGGARRADPGDRDAVRARWAMLVLGGFTLLHGAVMLATAQPHLPAVHVALHGVLLAGAVVFWLPVLGSARLPGFGRALYLFVACPCLDAAGLAVVVAGHQAEGVAMIVAMLPLPGAAVVSTWRALIAEERGPRQAPDPAPPSPTPREAARE